MSSDASLPAESTTTTEPAVTTEPAATTDSAGTTGAAEAPPAPPRGAIPLLVCVVGVVLLAASYLTVWARVTLDFPSRALAETLSHVYLGVAATEVGFTLSDGRGALATVYHGSTVLLVVAVVFLLLGSPGLRVVAWWVGVVAVGTTLLVTVLLSVDLYQDYRAFRGSVGEWTRYLEGEGGTLAFSVGVGTYCALLGCLLVGTFVLLSRPVTRARPGGEVTG